MPSTNNKNTLFLITGSSDINAFDNLPHRYLLLVRLCSSRMGAQLIHHISFPIGLGFDLVHCLEISVWVSFFVPRDMTFFPPNNVVPPCVVKKVLGRRALMALTKAVSRTAVLYKETHAGKQLTIRVMKISTALKAVSGGAC
jgi:hypothetical protein